MDAVSIRETRGTLEARKHKDICSMTDTKETAEESERILKWRAERQAVADKERLERAQAMKDARSRDVADEEAQKIAAARKLLPTSDDLSAARVVLHRQILRNRIGWWVGFVLFVLTPTFVVTSYMGLMAVPFYEARSVTVISSAAGQDNAGIGGLLGTSLGGGGQSLEKAFMAHEYLQSQALMELLERDLGLISELSSDAVDAVRRLRDIPFLRFDKRDQLSRFVESSVDIQSGLLTLYVRGLSPQKARVTSQHILTLMDKQINSLSEELFVERIAQSLKAVGDANEGLLDAQENLTRLQIDSGEVDPKARVEAIYATVRQLQTELEETRSNIAILEVAGQSNTYHSQRAMELAANLKKRIEAQRQVLFENSNGGAPLNSLLLDHELATLQVRIAQETLSAALLGLSEARKEAELGRSQFQVVVPPNTSSIPSSPDTFRAFLLTFLTTLALFSFYQMIRSSRAA